MSCLLRALVKVVASSARLTANVLGKLGSAAAKAGARAGRSCGKCGKNAGKMCHRRSAKACRIFTRHLQKASRKFTRRTQSCCKRCSRKCPDARAPLRRCPRTKTCKKCRMLCSKCPANPFRRSVTSNESKSFHRRTRKSVYKPKHSRKNGTSRKLRDRSHKEFKCSNSKSSSKGKTPQTKEHYQLSSHSKEDEGSKLQQRTIRRKKHPPPKVSKRPRLSNSSLASVSKDIMPTASSGVKSEKHKKLAGLSIGLSQARKEDGWETSVAPEAAMLAAKRTTSSASLGGRGGAVDKQPHSKLKRKSTKPKSRSQACPAVLTEDVHATRVYSQNRGKSEGNMQHSPDTSKQTRNLNTIPVAKRKRVQEQMNSNEGGAQLSTINSTQGIKQQKQKKQHEQPKAERKQKRIAEESASAQTHVSPIQNNLQAKDLDGESGGEDGKHGGKPQLADTEERSSQAKCRKCPANVSTAVAEVGCSTKDGTSKQRTAQRRKKNEPGDGKQFIVLDATSKDAAADEALVEKQKTKDRKRSSNKRKDPEGRPIAHTPEEDASETSIGRLHSLKRRNGPLTEHLWTRLELEDDSLPAACTCETKLPQAAKPTGPTPKCGKKLTEKQRIQSACISAIGPGVQYVTPISQSCDPECCSDEQLADEATLFGIECRVLPEPTCFGEEPCLP